MPTRARYAARFGCHGLHTDGTNPRFIARIVTARLTRTDDRDDADDKPNNGGEAATLPPTSLSSRAEGG